MNNRARFQICIVRYQVSHLNHLTPEPKLQLDWHESTQAKRRGCKWKISQWCFLEVERPWWEIQCISLPGVLENAFSERMGTFVDETPPTIRQCLLQQKTWSASDINPGAGRSSSLSSSWDADSRRHETMFINDLQWGPVTPHYRRPSRACASLFIFHHQSSSAEPVIRTCIDSRSICFVRLRKNTAGYVYTLKRMSYENDCVLGREGEGMGWGVYLGYLTLPTAAEACLEDSFPLGPRGNDSAFLKMSWDIWYRHVSHRIASCHLLRASCELGSALTSWANSCISPTCFLQWKNGNWAWKNNLLRSREPCL